MSIPLGDYQAEGRILRAYTAAVESGRASPAKLATLAAAVRQIDARRREHPLAYARLWSRARPRTSQRRAAIEALNATRMAFVLGGNRSGKSELGAQLVAAMALGGDHPAVVAWCRWNGLPNERIPTGPGRVWSVALTFGDSRRYVRPKVARYLGSGTVWRNREGGGEAEARTPGGGVVAFKAVQQGRAGFQGDSIRLLHFDEEPPDLAVVSEGLMRLADQGGRCILTMTPLNGWTALLAAEVRAARPGTVVLQLFGLDNPYVPREVLEELLARYGEHERAARERGEITALEGRIWGRFSRAVHVLPSDTPIDPAWPRFAGIDFGAAVETAILWGAYDEDRDILYIYRSYYKAQRTTAEIIRSIREAEADLSEDQEPVRWADPAQRQTRMDLARAEIQTRTAQKDVNAGISSVAVRLEPNRTTGRPRLYLLAGAAVELEREIESYVWQGEKPRKIADHACDALRYMCMGIQRMYGLVPDDGGEDEDDAA